MALGPNGANSDGALSELLTTTAKNFDGQGANFNKTIRDLGRFTGTLENNKEELFGSAAELERFVGALARNDKTVRKFNKSLSGVSDLLADERQELALSLKNLGTALGEVQTFVKDNKTLLSKNIKGLNRVSKTLVKRRGELDEILNVAPLALNNLALTYNPQAGTLDTAANLGNITNELAADPAVFLCTVVGQADPSGDSCDVIKTIFPAGRGLRLGQRSRSDVRPAAGGGPMMRIKLLLVLVVALLSSACDFSVSEMPLPGGADVGENPMTVHVQFPDVLDLVPQSTVKVADVTVGKVTHVELDGYAADVTLLLRNDVDLPDNAEAEIRQTSLLGEKFVSLQAPEDSPSPNKLSDGDRIKISATNRNPEVEEVLGALSLLLNGGGVAQLKTIASELNNALDGRESQAKSVLTQLSTFTGQLDENKADIVDAIESLNRLAKAANAQKPAIESALDDLPGALESLDSQRADLVKMLKALGRLGNVGTKVIRASKTATIDALTQLQPVLSQLAETGDDFAKSFNVFLTYPFVDEVVGRDPEVAPSCTWVTTRTSRSSSTSTWAARRRTRDLPHQPPRADGHPTGSSTPLSVASGAAT